MSVEEEYRLTVQLQRNELQILQRRCNELLHERSMMKAATAEDVRMFCLNYQQEQLQKQKQQPQTNISLTSATGTGTEGVPGRSPLVSSADSIPITAIIEFLHQYSSGMVPLSLCTRRKRSRETMGGGRLTSALSQQRLVQRVVARQRLRLREDDLEELQQGKELQQLQQGQNA
ncbi:hypothetical protein LSM04_005695 [Trypanosoma melophagium]|uniref:uncharacterized protein n=1 Tax=Trypanosoma melophagium TaxID=715481 RepID=UPI00351A47A2|nr:hypothetical protein LSM04_005695 [Trypanosoma melophagium]